jgi:hypothetical protein
MPRQTAPRPPVRAATLAAPLPKAFTDPRTATRKTSAASAYSDPHDPYDGSATVRGIAHVAGEGLKDRRLPVAPQRGGCMKRNGTSTPSVARDRRSRISSPGASSSPSGHAPEQVNDTTHPAGRDAEEQSGLGVIAWSMGHAVVMGDGLLIGRGLLHCRDEQASRARGGHPQGGQRAGRGDHHPRRVAAARTGSAEPPITLVRVEIGRMPEAPVPARAG